MIRCLVLISLLIQVTWAQQIGQPEAGGDGGGGGGGLQRPLAKPPALMKKWPTLSGNVTVALVLALEPCLPFLSK